MANLTYQFLNGSTTQSVCQFPCAFGGVFVNTIGATLTFADNATSTTFTPVIISFSPTSVGFYPAPFQTKNGLNVSVTGTGNYTVAFG